ncbi:MAG TPA: lipid IV(A) 3-deoxy-D-manno-octulosonic acid transferase [Gallionellaceae bacterium]
MFKSRLFYNIGLWLLLPYVFLYLVWRSFKQPEYLKHIGERFGFYRASPGKPVIWLHTVSVGETRAAATLVQRLLKEYPGHQLLLTHTTPTGRAASEQLFGSNVLRVYLPYDYPFAVARFLRHFRPAIGMLMETEIWLNVITRCHSANIPLLLLNARLSEKSATGYARFPNLTRTCLEQLASIAAQTEADASRLKNLGAPHVSVMGNLKFDIQPPETMLHLGKQLRELFGHSRKVFLAASTRDGEEALLLDALANCNVPGLLTVIVPRHPQRFNEVAALIEKRGLLLQRRSENRTIAPETQVVLGDSMGEMFAYYAACDLAFIGGSLLPFGGQNLIEACSVGKPVLIGPHTYNFEQASILAVSEGAALRLTAADELPAQLQRLFAHPEELGRMSQAGNRFVAAHRGATEVALETVRRYLLPNKKSG